MNKKLYFKNRGKMTVKSTIDFMWKITIGNNTNNKSFLICSNLV